MYVLEHLTEIKENGPVNEKTNKSINVNLPVDFIDNIHLMLVDQSRMMNTIKVLDSYIGRNIVDENDKLKPDILSRFHIDENQWETDISNVIHNFPVPVTLDKNILFNIPSEAGASEVTTV
jgi:hypothetical protein